MIWEMLAALWIKFPAGLLLVRLVVVPLSFMLHELAHGLAAALLGDPTPAENGRLTLNPAKHWEHIGLIGGVLIGVGWSRKTPISPHRMRVPGWLGGMLAVMAGPAVSAALAAGAVYALNASGLEVSHPWHGWPTLAQFLTVMAQFNLFYALVNLLPLHPLDGHTLIHFWLPLRAAAWWERVSGWTTTVLGVTMGVLLLAPPPLFVAMVRPVAQWGRRVFFGW